ncbi:MAG: NADPH-dependent FMN reductase [Bdellovibrionaceae bacterium]|nr:NADPH-dependent FMN reductase [Pseudobdellovibrionaceae bacterium]|tara:strand:- start:166 stop:693 length:528 start_codon:yes stop_codon:yes gene_type:complete
MKTVVGLIGSLRKGSVHRVIFNHYQDLSKKKFNLIEGDLSRVPLYNQDLDFPEEVKKLAELIRKSDGLLFFTPEYNYSVPGVLKNTIDWLSRVEGNPFNGKVSSIIGASPGNTGTARMQYDLRKIGVFLNLDFLNKPEVMIGQVFEKVSEEIIKDSDTIQFLVKHIEAFSKKMDS